MRRLWRDHRLLTAAFLLAVALTTFFAVRLVASWIYWNDPAHRDAEIAPWMTPRYVAHSWRLPPEIVAETLTVTVSERGATRLDDQASDTAMERRKKEGYF